MEERKKKKVEKKGKKKREMKKRPEFYLKQSRGPKYLEKNRVQRTQHDREVSVVDLLGCPKKITSKTLVGSAKQWIFLVFF